MRHAKHSFSQEDADFWAARSFEGGRVLAGTVGESLTDPLLDTHPMPLLRPGPRHRAVNSAAGSPTGRRNDYPGEMPEWAAGGTFRDDGGRRQGPHETAGEPGEEVPAPLGRAVGSNLVLGLINNITLRFGNLLLGVVLARLLAPSQFGVFAVALTIQAVLANLTDLGMTAYLVRCDDYRRRAPTVLTVGAAVGVVLTLIMVLTAHPLARAMGSVQATRVVQVMALTLILSGIGSVPTAVLQRRFQQGRQLAADATSFVVNGVVAIALIEAHTGALSLAWARVAAQLTAVVLLFVFSGYRDGAGFDREIARDAYRFGFPLMGANVLSWLLLNMDYVVVSRAFGATALGAYVLAFNIASWPTSAISQALRAVALPAFARVDSAEAPARARNVGAATALVLAAAAPTGALLVALASPVVLAVYGGNWKAAVAPLAVLGAFGAIRPVFDLLATYLTSRGAVRPVLLVQVAHTVTLLPALIIGVHVAGPAGAGVAHLIIGFAVVIPAYLWGLRKDGLRIVPVLLPSLLPVVVSAGAGVLAYGVSRPWHSPWAALLIGGAVAGLAYLAAMFTWLKRVFRTLRQQGDGEEAPGDEAVAEPGVVSESLLADRVAERGLAHDPRRFDQPPSDPWGSGPGSGQRGHDEWGAHGTGRDAGSPGLVRYPRQVPRPGSGPAAWTVVRGRDGAAYQVTRDPITGEIEVVIR